MNVVLEVHWTCSTILEYASVQKQSAVNADDTIRISAISNTFSRHMKSIAMQGDEFKIE